MTSLSCRCGKVVIGLTSTRPRVATECCCDSCFRRVQALQDLGGPTVDSSKPAICIKWDNCVVVEKGRDNLMVYKLTPETMVVNIASSCCHTFLLGRNSQYDANCVTTSQDTPIYDEKYVAVKPSSRWFSNQWSEERKERLQPLVGIWVTDDGTLAGEEGWKEVFERQLDAMNAPIPADAKGETFNQLLESLGCSTQILAPRQH